MSTQKGQIMEDIILNVIIGGKTYVPGIEMKMYVAANVKKPSGRSCNYMN
jgi:uncharacterized membrane protein YqaE (UPF0057 family)